VWKEGHENMVFEKIKNKLGYLPNPSVDIENDLNIKLWQQAKNPKKD